MTYEPASLEATWRERWAQQGRYEADPDPADPDPTFITVPYPYPSGGMHVGHCRTYTVPDVYARYRRLQGDTVLFPIAWHVTGTPIVGAVERLKAGDEEQISSLQDAFNVPEADLADLETPMGYARYFIEEAEASYKRGMEQLGLSIDWRREFTTNDDRYSKFIAWQYETLRDRGLLEKGLHPVDFCTNERQPVTDHDLLEGEDADHQEFTLVRFRREGGGVDGSTVFPMATLRPETVRGVTNAFVHPDATYVRATVDGEPWVVSEAATEKLDLQARDVTVEDRFPGSDLVGERVTNPVTGEDIVVLPATFVDPDDATGVVMSVPAHSPDDYVALEEATSAAADVEAEYGVDADAIRAIEPVPILEIDGYGEVPARDAVERAGVDATDDPELHAVTEELYRDEFHDGRLLASYGEFAGEVIEDVRESFRAHHRETGAFGAMYEYTEEVVCRCGGDVEVSVQDTWFIRYNDEDWREKARAAVDRIDAVPENTRKQYFDTIDWLEEWPCIRNYGLGTRLPWDEEFVIEPLSDSTIYMAYYTIAPRLREVPVEDLDRDFFDALFFGPDAVEDRESLSDSERSSGAERSSADHSSGQRPRDDGDETETRDRIERALELREEWAYWYPVDYRCSANDLIRNHLTFYLYHHAELFEAPDWPRGITSMGLGLLEGEKMSSSKGHVVLPGKAVDRYGADTVRFFLLNSAEPWQDYDWRADAVSATRDQLEGFWNRALEVIDRDPPDDPDLADVDRWLLAKLQEAVADVTEALERFETRTASQAAFYRFAEHLRWYRRRTDLDRPAAAWTRREVLRTRLVLLAPFVPFLANELHERVTGEPAEDAAWPEPDEALVDEEVLVSESLVADLAGDVEDILAVTGEDPDTIRVYVAADWKRTVFGGVREAGADVGAVMSEVMADPELRERGDAVNDLAGDLVEFARGRGDDELAALGRVDEAAVYEQAADFLAREHGAAVEVYPEDDADVTDPAGRADQAVPFRPAIHVA